MACLRDSMAIQLLAADKVDPLSLSPESSRRGPVQWSGCRRPYWQGIRVSYVKKLMWRHFSQSLSMWFFSLLCWPHKRKNSVSFKAKSNFNPFFSPNLKYESIRRTGSYEKSSSKFYFWWRLHCRSPTWTCPQLTASACLESSSLCSVLCECHNKGGPQVGTNVDIPSSNLFLVQRIFLHSDTHCQSHCKGSYDHTADSFSRSPTLSATRSPKQASEGAQNETGE